MRGLFVVAAVVLGLALETSASAQPIRVLLAPTTSQVLVTAPAGVVVEVGHERRSFPSSVLILPRLGGLLINGTWSPSDRLRLFSLAEDTLTVTFETPDLLTPAAPPAPPNRSSLRIAGSLHLAAQPQGLQAVNELELETYVAGVVPYEMNAAWPLEALKAQAVAARTYALYQQRANAGREYDLVAGVQDQVYRGRHDDPRAAQAVDATRGLVLLHQGQPILAAFSSTAAGSTEDAAVVWAKDLPYLKGVDCPFDTGSPYYRWRAAFTLEDLEAGLQRQGISLGRIATLAPLRYSRAGRVATLRLLHAAGETILRGEDLRRALGYSLVPSTAFEIESVGREVVLSGRGAGHAVGLCQWGAKELATLGYSFSTILSYYFPGAELAQLPAP